MTLKQDHIDWLLATAYNFIAQHLPDRAATLLELVRLHEPDNLQCLKLLACAWVESGATERAMPLLEELLERPLPFDDRSALFLLQMASVQGSGSAEQSTAVGRRFSAHLANGRSVEPEDSR